MSKTIKERVLEHISQYPDGLEEHIIMNYIGGDFHRHEVQRALEELVREHEIGINPKTYHLAYKHSPKDNTKTTQTKTL